MNQENVKDPLQVLYGDNALSLAADEINALKADSNFAFSNEYTRLGISFMKFKAVQIIEGAKKETTLKNLVSESFGEAAIATFNV